MNFGRSDEIVECLLTVMRLAHHCDRLIREVNPQAIMNILKRSALEKYLSFSFCIHFSACGHLSTVQTLSFSGLHHSRAMDLMLSCEKFIHSNPSVWGSNHGPDPKSLP